MKILFMGTPEFSAFYLEDLVKNNFDVIAVITQKDKPRGRGQRLLPTPVKEVAMKYGIPVFQPSNLNREGMEIIEEYKPEIGIVVAYGRLIKNPFLDSIPFYNVHTSLLPKYRGPAPMQRTIENGDKVTGITIFKISEGMDEGDIALQSTFEIDECETFGQVYERMIHHGTQLLKEFLIKYPLPLIPQNHSLATYAPKITKEDLYVDFSKPAIVVRNKIRAYDPTPGARARMGKFVVKLFGACGIEEIPTSLLRTTEIGQILKINKDGALIKTMNDGLWVKYLQFPGRGKISFIDAKNGGLVIEEMKLEVV
ncbi:MAG TPA: methionyl-tRNA formyltransferase [Fervidobacterium sp.]|nr:methionyl-tRNA formyltransferase [Fervidobacterium sp.]HRD20229.1 methionyl-tRNA formyltransferase [Fervidobacterium sp.]